MIQHQFLSKDFMMRDACGDITALQKPKELTVVMLIHDFWRPFVASSIKEADFAEVRLPRPLARSAVLVSYSLLGEMEI